jgi:hypothetical protein
MSRELYRHGRLSPFYNLAAQRRRCASPTQARVWSQELIIPSTRLALGGSRRRDCSPHPEKAAKGRPLMHHDGPSEKSDDRRHLSKREPRRARQQARPVAVSQIAQASARRIPSRSRRWYRPAPASSFRDCPRSSAASAVPRKYALEPGRRPPLPECARHRDGPRYIA